MIYYDEHPEELTSEHWEKIKSILNKMKIKNEIPPEVPPNTFVALDIEMFGMDKKRLHRPTTGKLACLTLCHDLDTVYYTTKEAEIPAFLSKIKDCIWVFHNAKFDIMQLRRWATIPPRTKLWDTMLIEQNLWSGYYDGFKLSDLVRRYLNRVLDKSLQKEFANATELTPELLEYSVADTPATLEVCIAQQKIVTNKHWKIYHQVDFPAIWAVLDFKGFPIDTDQWTSLAHINKLHADTIKEEMVKEYGIAYSQFAKLKALLKTKGYPSRLPDANALTLAEYITKFPDTEATKIAKISIEGRKYAKRASTYGLNFLKSVAETDPQTDISYVYGDYWISEASTGRMSCKGGVHSIPKRDTLEFRKCFIASPNNKLIIVDYSQQEVGIAAFLSQDKALIKAVNSDKSVYVELAKEVFGKDITKDDPLYDDMKSVILGADYGMSKFGMAKKLGVSDDEAEKLLVTFFKKFPDFDKYMLRQEKKKKYVETVWGRKFWLNQYSNQCPRNARNSPIQGTAADMIKIALSSIHKEWKWNIPYDVCGIFHDELVLDTSENLVDDVGVFVSQKMIEAGTMICPGIRFRADYVIADNWAKL